jgi:hypothetical protein
MKYDAEAALDCREVVGQVTLQFKPELAGNPHHVACIDVILFGAKFDVGGGGEQAVGYCRATRTRRRNRRHRRYAAGSAAVRRRSRGVSRSKQDSCHRHREQRMWMRSCSSRAPPRCRTGRDW